MRPVERKTLQCENCGVEFERMECQIKDNKHYYCSKECYWQAKATGPTPGNKKKWREEHPESVKESQVRYYRKNREKELGRQKRYNEEHPDRAYATRKKCREGRKEKDRQYREANKDKYRLIRRRYQQRKRSAISTLRAREIPAILEAGCLFCGAKEDLVLAHDVAVSKGGGFTRANIFCLCSLCNVKMRTLSLADKLEQRTLLPTT